MSKIYVRSQDKKHLKKVESIWISSVTVNNPNNYNMYDEGRVYYTIVTDGVIVGKYETEARAIEVLDEIFNILNKCNGIILTPLKEKQIRDNSEDIEQKKKFVSSNNELKSFSCDVVYQIPKE